MKTDDTPSETNEVQHKSKRKKMEEEILWGGEMSKERANMGEGTK